MRGGGKLKNRFSGGGQNESGDWIAEGVINICRRRLLRLSRLISRMTKHRHSLLDHLAIRFPQRFFYTLWPLAGVFWPLGEMHMKAFCGKISVLI